jgi:hypothetical protein
MNDTATLTRLQSRKGALGESRLVREPRPNAADGEVVVKIDRFALTTNNITYLTFGEAPLHYWSFFPSGDPAWAQMPVWGFADVVDSSVPGVAVGERFYGYFPIASFLTLKPERISARGFFDGSEHRRALTSAYNLYSRCSADPAYTPEHEDYQALLRPLFVTSFMLADFIEDNAFFGATRIVVSSASSKTAFGTAFCLQGRPDLELIALTSAGNRAFVEALNCYGQVVSYDELATLSTDRPTLYLDFSGDHGLRTRVHDQLGAALVYDCLIGFAQTTEMVIKGELRGPRPKFFFAPEQIRKRTADWGPDEFNRRFNAAQSAFIGKLSAAGNAWMRVVEHQGFEAAQALVADLVAGKMDPKVGHIVRL